MNFTAWTKNHNSFGRIVMIGVLLMSLLTMACTGAMASSARGSIQGCVFVDENMNLICDSGEQLITGVSVSLERAVGDGWETVETIKSDTYGKYAFETIEAGEYRIVSSTNSAELMVASVGQSVQLTDDYSAVCSAILSVEAAQRLENASDIGLRAISSLIFTSFQDENGDGVQAKKDRAASGVKVEVMSGDTAIAYATTDANGVAQIAKIPAGQYQLRVTLPIGYGFTAVGEQPLEGQSCVAGAGSEATSETFAFVAGEGLTTAAAVKAVGSFSGMIFEDMDNNGIYDEGEPGVAGVAVNLAGKRTGTSLTLASDDAGRYSFASLADDSYTISIELPQNMLYARYSKTGGDLRSIFSGATTERVYQIKKAANITDMYVGVIENGVISGTAFLDVNYNGVYDADEPAYKGVTLEVIKPTKSDVLGKTVTGDDGIFRIEGLRSGQYRVRALLPDDGSIFTIVPQDTFASSNLFAQYSSRRDQTIGPLTVVSGEAAEVLVGVAVGAKVTGTVFEDKDYSGAINGKEKKISGLKVQLVNEAGEIVASEVTNGKGVYAFSGIMPGNYTLEFQRKKGHGFTRLRPLEKGGSYVKVLEGEYGITDAITIAMAQEIADVNAGMLPSSTLTGIVFDDLNDNGLQDADEAGYTVASVRLLSNDNETDLVEQVNEDGSYFFDGVMPGQYTLTYILPEHATIARVVDGGNTLEGTGVESTTAPFTVKMGEAYECYLVGAVTLGNFQGIVFRDVNANGTQDAGEECLAGVELTLTPDVATAEEVKAVSGADGSYAMEGLRPAQYKLSIHLPQGYILSHSLVQDGLVLDAKQAVTVDCSWRILINRSAKQIGAVKPSTVSGVIWLDENKDGIRDDDESLFDNISIELINEKTGNLAKRTMSNDQGFTFTDVRAGNYTVRFSMPSQSEAADDRMSTFVHNNAYMENTGIVVLEDQTVSNLTTGLVSRTSVGGKLWLDENNANAAVNGISIRLYEANATLPLQTTTTDENGQYRFDGLWPGDYYMVAELPDGMIFVKPEDPNYQQGASVITTFEDGAGTSELFSVEMARHMLSQNIIFIKPAKVGDQIWLDENGNGLVDGTEPKISGVTVKLMQDGVEMYRMQSDEFGYYLFAEVYPGSYTLQAEAYPELGITQSVPELRIISSCLVSGDGKSAASDEFTVESGSLNMNFDLGYILIDGQQFDADGQRTTRNWNYRNEIGPL